MLWSLRQSELMHAHRARFAATVPAVATGCSNSLSGNNLRGDMRGNSVERGYDNKQIMRDDIGPPC